MRNQIFQISVFYLSSRYCGQFSVERTGPKEVGIKLPSSSGRSMHSFFEGCNFAQKGAHAPTKPFKYGWLLVGRSQRKWHAPSIFRAFLFLPLSILLPWFLLAHTTTLTWPCPLLIKTPSGTITSPSLLHLPLGGRELHRPATSAVNGKQRLAHSR